jgi:membrane protein implicated in regulation of membrane protease activity
VGVLYLAALVVGLGSIALQLLLAGDANADASGDVHAADGAHAHGHDAPGHGEGGASAIFLSLRFWTFALLAFGLAGTLLHYLGLASRGASAAVAILMGLLCGFTASWTLRMLARAELSSGAQSNDALGQVGKVLVPCSRDRRGKVRIELRGQTLDYVASTDDEELAAGERVLVEEVRGNTVHVSRAPRELLP